MIKETIGLKVFGQRRYTTRVCNLRLPNPHCGTYGWGKKKVVTCTQRGRKRDGEDGGEGERENGRFG